jgi:hypothetical protein
MFFIITLPGAGRLVYGETQVSISVSDNLVTIGDKIALKIIVKTGQDAQDFDVRIPEEKKFEYLGELPVKINRQKDYMVLEKTVIAAFFELGDFEVGPFTVELRAGDRVVASKRTNSVPVTVKSVLSEEDKDIRDLKGLMDIKGDPFYVLKYVIIAVAATLLAVFLFMWWRRRRQQVPAALEPELSPLEELESRIQRLWNMRLFEKGKIKLHFIELTKILKHFLLRNYNFNAEDFTTYETLMHLKKAESEAAVLDNMRFVFDTADLVKFAKFIPDAAVIGEVADKIKDMAVIYKVRITPPTDEENREDTDE